MILYQMAKQMERRSLLDRTIRESDGDVCELIGKKTEIEQWMRKLATKWTEADLSSLAVGDVE